MKKKLLTFVEGTNQRESKTIQNIETIKHNFIVKSFISLVLTLSLAFLFSCTQEDIGKPDMSTSNEKLIEKSATFSIGQNYGGGIIFYIDATGQHGLIADINDTNYKMLKWGDAYYLNTGATGTAVGTGAANTKKIIAVQGTKYIYAALVCANYRGGGYSDWFLPSKDELYLLYKQKVAGVVKGFTWGAYWSSSEFYVATNPPKQAYAWTKIFYSENAFYSLKDRVSGVRAIRAF